MKTKPKLDLAQIRLDIDTVDEQIVGLLAKRARLARQAGAAKPGKQKLRPEREEQVIKRVVEMSEGELPAMALKSIYREIIGACLSLESPLTIGYLGPEGTYSEEAARVRFSSSAIYKPYASLAEALAAAESGKVDLAILPIENSTEGSVNQTLDLLLDTNLKICGELLLPVRHQLLSRTGALVHIERVAGHPQSLAQCRVWLQGNVPGVQQLAVASNAEAARLAQADPKVAALAGKRAADIYELPMLAKDVQDQANNTTRFVVLGDLEPRPSGSDKTSLVCSVPNRPGTLYKLLGVLAESGVNLSKLESRPSANKIWDYVFYIDIEGHCSDETIASALKRAEQATTMLKVLGSYPKG